MLLSRSMVEALLKSITHPRSRLYKLENKKLWLMDKASGEFGAVCLKNRVVSKLEN